METLHSPTLLIPKASNYANIDGLLFHEKKWYPLQMTINKTKYLVPRLYQEFWNRHSKSFGETLPLYFVVPGDEALRTKLFGIEGARTNKDSPSVKWAKKMIKQFVIPFPLKPERNTFESLPQDIQTSLMEMEKEMTNDLVNKK